MKKEWGGWRGGGGGGGGGGGCKVKKSGLAVKGMRDPGKCHDSR